MGVIATPFDGGAGFERGAEEGEAVSEDALRGGEDGEFEERSAEGGGGGFRVGQRERGDGSIGEAGFGEGQVNVGGFLAETEFDFGGATHALTVWNIGGLGVWG